MLKTNHDIDGQAAGKVQAVGPLADVYSLGAILYFLLTGHPPFRGQNVLETLKLVLENEPVPPTQRGSSVDFDLETICLKCLQKDPARRYESAQALADDLRRYRDGEPILARPISTAGRAVKWVKRRPVISGLLAVILIVVIAGFVGTYSQYREAVKGEIKAEELAEERGIALGQAVAARIQAEVSETKAKNLAILDSKARRRAENQLYANWVSQAARETEFGNLERSDEILDLCPVEQRGWEWRFLRNRNRFIYPQQIFEGNSGPVSGLSFSPDGKLLAAGGGIYGKSGEIMIWDTRRGTQHATLTGHTGSVSDVAFSVDGKRLASASADGTVRLWDVGKAAEILKIEARQGFLTGVAFSPDGSRLASVGGDGTVKVHDALKGSELQVLRGHRGTVFDVTFSPQGNRLASAGEDKTVRIWNLANGREEFSLTKHTSWVMSVAFSLDGKRLVSASVNKSVRVWDLTNRSEIFTEFAHGGSVSAVAFSPDGHRLVSVGQLKSDNSTIYGEIKLWDIEKRTPILTVRGHAGGVRCVTFSPDGSHFATGGKDHRVWLWDCRLGSSTLTLKNHRQPVEDVAVSRDGNRIASASSDARISICSARTGEVLRVIKPSREAGGFYSVEIRSDGHQLAAAKGGANPAVLTWDTTADSEERVLQWQAGSVLTRVAYSPDGKLLVAVGGKHRQYGEITAWDSASGAMKFRIAGHTQPISGLSFSPDGRFIATSSFGGMIKLWDVESRKELRSFPGHTQVVWNVTFSHNGKLLASACQDGTAKIWDVQSGNAIHTFQAHSGILRDIAFSPDDKSLAAGGSAFHLWNLTTGVRVMTVDESAYAVALSPDGATLVTGGFSGAVTMRRAPETAIERTLKGTTKISSISFSPDNSHVIAQARPRRRGATGEVHAWNLQSGELVTNKWKPVSHPQRMVISPNQHVLAWVIDVTNVRIRYFEDNSKAARDRRQDEDHWTSAAWHVQQLSQAEQRRDRFAAAFHRTSLRDQFQSPQE